MKNSINVYEFLNVSLDNASYHIRAGDYTGLCGTAWGAIEGLILSLAEQDALTEEVEKLLEEALQDLSGSENLCIGYMLYGRAGDLSLEAKEVRAGSIEINEVDFADDGIIDELIFDADQVPESIRNEVRRLLDNSEIYFYADLDLKGLLAAIEEQK